MNYYFKKMQKCKNRKLSCNSTMRDVFYKTEFKIEWYDAYYKTRIFLRYTRITHQEVQIEKTNKYNFKK